MMNKILCKKAADKAFLLSLIGVGVLVSMLIVGAAQVQQDGEIIKEEVDPWIRIVGGVGGVCLGAGALWLWIRAIALRFREYQAGHSNAFFKLLIAVVGNIYTAFIFYFLDRKKDVSI